MASCEFSWPKRQEFLRRIKRYGKFRVMFYRTDLSIHTRRVSAIVKHLFQHVNLPPGFDVKKAILIARYHDDYELIPELGDIPLHLKLQMNGLQKSDLEKREIAAAMKIASQSPLTIDGYDYLGLLLHAIHKDCPEAQFVSFADKIDGYCEALHETLAGNNVFLEPVINYPIKSFSNLPEKFPLIKEFFPKPHPTDKNPFNFPVIDFREYFDDGAIGPCPHTLETISRKTEFPHYELWKKVTYSAFKNGRELLTKQIEFHADKSNEVKVA